MKFRIHPSGLEAMGIREKACLVFQSADEYPA
jgi:hypothetical protein